MGNTEETSIVTWVYVIPRVYALKADEAWELWLLASDPDPVEIAAPSPTANAV